jgi:hypothetical protein
MKPITFFLFLWFSITAAAQSISTEDGAAAAVITKSGVPAGAKTEVKVTKDGGRLKSSDGKIELLIPPGAVSKKTDISIQPVTNEMPNGNGKAYRLEPSGILFQKPIQLVFHYDEEAVKDSMQLLLGIAMQQEDGRWYNLNKFALDTTAKTISGSINHFSDWSNFSALKIYPTNIRLKVKKSNLFFITGTMPLVEESNDELTSLVKTKSPKQVTWQVNDITGGNDVFGIVKGIDDSKIYLGNYLAPDAVPEKQNPVALSADLKGLTYAFNKMTFKSLKLVSNILVYDNAYEVSMISSIDAPSAGTELGRVVYKDTGSFIVSLEKGVAKVIEKVNKNTSDEFEYKGKCLTKVLNPGTNYGNIHITGVRSIKVTQPKPPAKNATIEISFIQAPVKLSLLQIICPDSPPFTSSDRGMFAMMPAYPMVIKFEAKEEEQTIYQVGKEGEALFLRFTVKQLKEE